MANYVSSARTNYFRVTDEKRYEELFSGLISEDGPYDFTEEKDGILYHGFGGSCIDYLIDEEEYECDFDYFLDELQKILPDDEAFIYMESGAEKLRYLVGFCIVLTNKDCRTLNMENWGVKTARELLGNPEFHTETTY